MKLSKKILGAVLCGLIVVGGSNATLVKADAQEQWSEGVCFETHTKGMPGFRDFWSLNLVLEHDQLQLRGRTNMPLTTTFNDVFHIGWHKQFDSSSYYPAPIVFRGCWQANGGDALRRAEEIFNRAHLGVGDKIFIYGEKYDDSVKFLGSHLITSQESRISYNNNYDVLYRKYDRHHTTLLITEDGLKPVHETREI